MIARIAAAIGLPVSGLAWIAFALAITGAAAVSGALVHSYDRAQHDKVVADLRGAAATEMAAQTATVLALLQDQIDATAKLEEESAHAAEERSRLVAEGGRLSADLDAAHQRLRALAREGGGGGGAAPAQGTVGADGCAAVRAALGRALDAVELLKEGGDRAAELGQRAVDVATVAAQDARQREAKR